MRFAVVSSRAMRSTQIALAFASLIACIFAASFKDEDLEPFNWANAAELPAELSEIVELDVTGIRIKLDHIKTDVLKINIAVPLDENLQILISQTFLTCKQVQWITLDQACQCSVSGVFIGGLFSFVGANGKRFGNVSMSQDKSTRKLFFEQTANYFKKKNGQLITAPELCPMKPFHVSETAFVGVYQITINSTKTDCGVVLELPPTYHIVKVPPTPRVDTMCTTAGSSVTLMAPPQMKALPQHHKALIADANTTDDSALAANVNSTEKAVEVKPKGTAAAHDSSFKGMLLMGLATLMIRA